MKAHPTTPAAVAIPQPVASLHFFETKEDAITFRAMTGAGGWIFVSQDKGEATLFPPTMTPRDIFLHPLIRGVVGWLVGENGKEVQP